MVELSPGTYIALLAMVREELQHESDASPLLKRAEAELARAVANDHTVHEDLTQQPERVEALRRAGRCWRNLPYLHFQMSERKIPRPHAAVAAEEQR